MKRDTSTIDHVRLSRLSEFQVSYLHLGDEGMGCALDPPGYPTYFLQPVYTSNGNNPGRGPQTVLLGHVVETHDTPYEQRAALMKRFYLPLPWEHPRVQAWVRNVFRHQGCMYYDDAAEGRDKQFVFPVPYYKLKTFRDDPRFNDEWRAGERARVAATNQAILDYYTPRAIPANATAVRTVREFYPDFSDEEATVLINARPTEMSGWWERHDEPPALGECPGDVRVNLKHKNERCQFCGASSRGT